LSGKADRARDAVAKLTAVIEQMRQSRDENMADISRLQLQIEVCGCVIQIPVCTFYV